MSGRQREVDVVTSAHAVAALDVGGRVPHAVHRPRVLGRAHPHVRGSRPPCKGLLLPYKGVTTQGLGSYGLTQPAGAGVGGQQPPIASTIPPFLSHYLSHYLSEREITS